MGCADGPTPRTRLRRHHRHRSRQPLGRPRRGRFSLEQILSLFDAFEHLEDGLLAGIVRTMTARRRLKPGFEELPLIDAQVTVLAGSRMPYRAWLTASDPDDPLWQPMRLSPALQRVDVPVLLQEGWQDRFVDQMLDQYKQLRRRGVTVGLTVGPWTHVGVATKAVGAVTTDSIDWLADHLNTEATAPRRPEPIRIFITGPEEWRYLPEWPPATTPHALPPPRREARVDATDRNRRLINIHLRSRESHPGRRRTSHQPNHRRPPKQLKLERRGDVITFTSLPLTTPLEIIGNPTVELIHHSDNPHADLFVRLCEVTPNEVSTNISDGFRRLRPENSTTPIEIRLDAIAHTFSPGSRIRLQISGGAHPRYARNLGTDDDPATGTRLAPSHRTITHHAGGISHITLPCPA